MFAISFFSVAINVRVNYSEKRQLSVIPNLGPWLVTAALALTDQAMAGDTGGHAPISVPWVRTFVPGRGG